MAAAPGTRLPPHWQAHQHMQHNTNLLNAYMYITVDSSKTVALAAQQHTGSTATHWQHHSTLAAQQPSY